MKKYNTPEMKVSMFNEESVLTVSSGFATFDAFTDETGTAAFVRDWDTLKNEISVTF